MSTHSKFKHDGKYYTITINEAGRFGTVIDGDEVHHETLKGLQDKIVRTTRRAAVRIALPATLVEGKRHFYNAADAEGLELIDVTITGIHQRGGDILILLPDGKRDRISHYHGQLLRRLDANGKAKYLELHKEHRAAKKSFDDFTEKHDFNKKTIEAEVSKAEKAAGIEDGEKD